jgi:hypothetical protein
MSSNFLSQNVQQNNINLRVNDITSRGTIYVENLSLPYSTSNINMGASGNIECSSSVANVGTQIATAANQKLGFHGVQPGTQHSSSGETVGFTVGSGTSANDDSYLYRQCRVN